MTIADRYTALLKKSLLNETSLEAEVAYYYSVQPELATNIKQNLPSAWRKVSESRRVGRHLWPALKSVGFAATMIGRLRMDNIEHCVRTAVEDGVPGDLIECGVWRGGATIFMRGLLAALGETGRVVWVADTFSGLPQPDADRGDLDLSRDKFPQLAVSVQEVADLFDRFDLLDDTVRFLVGLFSDTLPQSPIERLAVLRIDADYYASTLDALDSLYERVSPGGFIIVDDYSLLPPCRAAVDFFRKSNGVTDSISEIDQDGIFWRKGATCD